MKKGAILFLMSIIFIEAALANPLSITADGKVYDVELLAVNKDSVDIRIINETKNIRNTQSSAYNPEIFSPSFPELKYVLIDRHYGDYLGDMKYADLLIFIQKNISLSAVKKISLSYGKMNYDFEVHNIVSINQANVRLNNGSDVLATVQNLPYTPEKISTLSDLLYVLTYVDSNSANLLLGFEINLLFQCSENWTCSDWGSCINNTQIRTCKDSNYCGSKKNMPFITYDCVSEKNITEDIISCVNECNSSEKICFNESSFKSCVDNDNDNCTEWENPILCSENGKMICSEGKCLEIPKNKSIFIIGIIFGLLIIIVIAFVLVIFKLKKTNGKRKKKK